MERLIASNIKPARVGAMERTPILAKLLIPMAVEISLGSTILIAKDCLIGMVKLRVILNIIRSAIARGYQLVRAKAAVTAAEISRDQTIVPISPILDTMKGMRR
jgi:hypothetical protein